ncbi:hypothetical protein Tco_1377249 [Tanacetum coccineum]
MEAVKNDIEASSVVCPGYLLKGVLYTEDDEVQGDLRCGCDVKGCVWGGSRKRNKQGALEMQLVVQRQVHEQVEETMEQSRHLEYAVNFWYYKHGLLQMKIEYDIVTFIYYCGADAEAVTGIIHSAFEVRKVIGIEDREVTRYKAKLEDRARREEELFTRAPLSSVENKKLKHMHESRFWGYVQTTKKLSPNYKYGFGMCNYEGLAAWILPKMMQNLEFQSSTQKEYKPTQSYVIAFLVYNHIVEWFNKTVNASMSETLRSHQIHLESPHTLGCIPNSP